MLQKRIKTGIPGLDDVTEGGLLEGSATLVTGGTGTGKTLLCAQFLWEGLQKGEPCLFITMEESPDDIKSDALAFGWDFEKYEKKKQFRIIYHDPSQASNLAASIINELANLKVARLAIDSVSVLGLTMESKAEIRRRLFNIIATIKRNQGTTALITSEVPEGSKALSVFGVEEFVADGVIVLNYLNIGGEAGRSLRVRKMRRTNHGKDLYPLDIRKTGLSIRKV
jgi:KaiC/GvpD/RAD55 family RecA-like ATPase